MNLAGRLTLLEQILDPNRPVPWQAFEVGNPRPVILPIVVLHQTAVLMAHPVRADPFVYLPPQGGIHDGESVVDAARRELREEIPSFARKWKGEPPRVAWHQWTYLGSAENPCARSGRPNMVHVLALPTTFARLRADGVEVTDPMWVYDPDTAEQLLGATAAVNPIKAQIVAAGIRLAAESGMLVG